MPTEAPDLVQEFEDQKQSAPDLVSEFEQQKTSQQPDLVSRYEADQEKAQPDLVAKFEADQQKTAQQRPDFTQEALSGKLAQPAGAPTKLPAEKPAPPVAIPRGRGDVSQAKDGYFPPTDIPIQGVKDIAEGYQGFDGLPVPLKQMPAARGQMPRPVAPKPQVSPEERDVLTQQENQRAAAATKIIAGAGEVGTVALPGSIAAAPVSTALSIGAGVLSSKAAGHAVHGKVSPEAEDLVRATAFFIPSVLGTAAGVKSAKIETPQGKFSAVEALGGKVRAGIARTPDVTSGRVKIGDTQFEVNIPRNGAQAPAATPPPALDEATAAMVRYEQNAGNIPKPPPPVPPPTPGQQFGNKLSGDQVDHLAETIAKAPPESQNALIEEAHKNMVSWINDNQGKVFIDGKIQISKSPDQTEALAAKIINDASSAHDKAQELAAKEADKAQKEQEKQTAAKTARSSAPAPAPKPAAAPAKVEAQPQSEAPQSQPAAEKPAVQKSEEKPQHDFASTQVNIDPKSELGQQHAQAVATMPEDHIGPNGKEDTPHVTVRYGLKDDSPEAIAKIKEAASKIAPFEATVGKTSSFPATKEGDRPIIARVEKSPELNALRSVVEGAGDFKEDTHGEYKPHVTLGYVKPEHVAEYEGGSHLEGGKVPVDHVTVTKRDGTSETIKLGGKPVPDLVAQHEATPDLVAEHEAQPERRTNLDQRKKVADMSPEERAKALLTSETVDLPNKRAFTEAEHAGKSPAVAMSDADGLKALNDKFGYDAGNALLKAKAEALKEAGLDSYHDKGDEFLHRGESPEDLKTKLSKARDILKNRVISVEKSDGTVLKFKGADFSYGTGKDLDTAEAGLKAHKSQREAAGERARGELRGIVEAGSENSEENNGGTEATQGHQEPQSSVLSGKQEIHSEAARQTAAVKLPEGAPAKVRSGRIKIAERVAKNKEVAIASPISGIPSALNPGDKISTTDGRTGKVVGTYLKGAKSVKLEIGGKTEVVPARNLAPRDTLPAVSKDKGAGSNPSATPQGQQAVDSPEFKKWFDGSKVVNADGSPRIVYHGTSAPFDRVDMSKGAQGTFWLTTDKGAIERGESGATGNSHILSAYVSIKNPAGWDEYDKKSIGELIRDGYDGVILPEDGQSNIVAFEPEQVRIIKEPPKSDSVSLLQSGGMSAREAARAKIKASIKGKPSERGFAHLDIPSVLTHGVADPVTSFVKDTIKQTAESRSVDDKLFGLSKQYEADVLRAIELMKQVGPLSTPEDQAAIYHHLEDSSVPLDSKQQAVLDKIVKPLMQQSSAIRSELNNAGVPMGEEGYVHRVVQGKSSQLERAMRGKQGTGKGNVLSRSAASLKQRKMFALEDEDGNRQVVSMEGGRITGFKSGAPEDLGASPRLKVGDNFNDKTGKPWTLQQATTKEIESATNLKYYKNALASAVTDYLQLLRAKRANDALESMKSDPGFNQMAFKSEKGSMPPDGWRSVDLPQFRDYYFEPHMAEVLNRFAKELHPDPVTFLEKVGNFMTASLLLNPIRHVYNIANHWLVERGVSGTFNPLTWPTAAKAGMKAIKAVVNQNEDFLSALDHGAPMMSHRTDLQQLHHELFQTIVGHLEKNPSIANKIAEFVGYDKAGPEDTGLVNAVARGTGLRMLNNVRKLGQKAMWMSNDMMMLQSAYEKMAGDSSLTFEDAMKQTEKHIPNYRIPTRILNSKAMGDFMGSRLASMFGRYHYGVWRSYGEMLKESLGPDSTPKERLKGLDHMIMLGMITFLLYKLVDEVLKKITGDRDARMVRSGASAAPNSIKEIIQGHEDPSQLLRNTFTPAILPQATAEAMFNRDFFSGAPVRNPKHSAGKQVIDVSKHFMNALGPVQQYNQATRNSRPAKSFLLSQVGVSTSHPKKHR
jgi:2'-5' RNA ligase/GGDEF domain-containing protein